MARYTTQYGLPQIMVDYLNQPLPDISNLYTPPVKRIDPIRPGPDDPEGIVSLYPLKVASSGDGDSYSVYNPDPTRTRTLEDYNPYAYRQAAAKSGLGIPSGILADSSYLYPEKNKLDELMTKFPSMFGLLSKGLGALVDKLPVNRTAILQNELLGQGIMLDDIGRIVAKDYNTPEGIMAGYNPVSGGLLNMLTGGKYGEPTTYGLDKSFDQRRETIADTLRDKYGMSEPEIAAALKGEYTGPIQTPLINRLSLLNQAQKKFQSAQTAADIITQRKEAEKREAASQKTMAEARELQKKIDARPSAQADARDRARGGDRSPSPSRSTKSGISSSERGRALHG